MIAILDYKAGNLTSVSNALTSLGIENVVTHDPEVIRKAERIIFPGVGAAGSAMDNLHQSGMDKIIHEQVESGKPFLGICLGTQIILSASDEDDGTLCLDVIRGKAVKFEKEDDIKIPHMGWNAVNYLQEHPIFDGIPSGRLFYFVHSYYPDPMLADNRLAETTYGTQTFASALIKGNLVSTQFHPEKSGEVGLKLLSNFAKWEYKG